MEKRRLGRTDHHSAVAILGGFIFLQASREEAELLLQEAMDAGVNHMDIAPLYGLAETRVGELLPAVRGQFFLACKTAQRDAVGARAELERSLELLRTDHFDLYQLHGVTTPDEMRACLRPGGALEALMQARDEGLVRFVGITGHFERAPAVFADLLQDADLDTVMFPVSAAMWRIAQYRDDAERLMELCRERDLGVMAIKVVARGPWRDDSHRYQTWYEPLDKMAPLQRAVDFALTLPVHGFCTPGEPRLLGRVLRAAEQFQSRSSGWMENEVRSGTSLPLLMPTGPDLLA